MSNLLNGLPFDLLSEDVVRFHNVGALTDQTRHHVSHVVRVVERTGQRTYRVRCEDNRCTAPTVVDAHDDPVGFIAHRYELWQVEQQVAITGDALRRVNSDLSRQRVEAGGWGDVKEAPLSVPAPPAGVIRRAATRPVEVDLTRRQPEYVEAMEATEALLEHADALNARRRRALRTIARAEYALRGVHAAINEGRYTDADAMLDQFQSVIDREATTP